MKIDPNEIIGSYLRKKDTVFTSDEFCSYLKENGIKLSKSQAEDLLHSSDFVFSLINNDFITRAGVFTGRWFSFKPSKEEIEKGHFIIGHRCMPFLNPEFSPYNITIVSDNRIVKPEATEYSMNLALDTFAMFGEGYVIPYVINDSSNKEISLSSVQYTMPSKINLTSWAFSELKGGEDVKYGDRIICRVIDWQHGYVEMEIESDHSDELVVSQEDIDREDWYGNFENGILESLDRHGPCSSIEEQLSFLFLENQEELCQKSCGSIDEFLEHTSKIDFEPYGVENRIWKAGEIVPYSGEWNKSTAKEQLFLDMALIFTPQVVDAYLKNSLYKKTTFATDEDLENFLDSFLPKSLSASEDERNVILLNIKKRRDILEEDYSPFLDYDIADVRERSLDLFTKVSSLLCAIGCSEEKVADFPQQELVILSQLFGHLVRLIEEFENTFSSERLPKEDIMLSLDGMEDTFDEISGILKASLGENRIKGFEILTD